MLHYSHSPDLASFNFACFQKLKIKKKKKNYQKRFRLHWSITNNKKYVLYASVTTLKKINATFIVYSNVQSWYLKKYFIRII